MPKLTIDGQPVEVAAGSTLLAAARQLGLDVPTLCYLEGGPHRPSCMACVMKVAGANRYVASCATVAEDGMVVESESAGVRAARKLALELLLSDHVGDCVAVCERRCPADVPIPAMIERMQAGKFAEAAALAKEAHPFPAMLGRVCSAPCEHACRRNKLDEAVAIRDLERQAGDAALTTPVPPACAPPSGQSVAIIGGGPTGLTAAWFLRQHGHAVTIFEATEQLGGHLRATPHADVLDGEIGQIMALGVDCRLGRYVTELPAGFAASIIATGKPVAFPEHPGVFRAIQAKPETVLSVAGGRRAAVCVDQYLRGVTVVGEPEQYTSTIASFNDSEFARFAATARDAVTEAGRCFQCACAAADSCRLRHYADVYGAQQKHFRGARREFERDESAAGIIFQRGKCISCGLCVWMAHGAGEPVGLTFVKRGFQQQVAGALGSAIEQAVQKSGEQCVKVCPTGALKQKK
jgi:ferredoxin